MPPPKTFWLSAGETSGDLHGALLLRALKEHYPALRCIGMGGSAMRQAGLEALFNAEALSIMGATEILRYLPRILRMLLQTKKALASRRPDALIVIDAPSYHFPLIRMARAMQIPVYYYISPKIWASRPKRVFFLKKHVRKIYSILPFEKKFYKQYDIDIEYIGNPLVDLVDYERLESIPPQKGLIGLLPGSREKEIKVLLPQFAAAAEILKKHFPELQFILIQSPNISRELIQASWPVELPVKIEPAAKRWEIMRRCEFLIAASGTVTLESALVGTPTLVTYKVSQLTFAIAKNFVHVPYISLPNLIMQKQVFPELLQEKCNARSLAAQALQWLHPDFIEQREQIIQDLLTVRNLLGTKGAVQRAAASIVNDFLAQNKGKDFF